MTKQIFSFVFAIVATGAILNMAGQGTLGVTAQKTAQFITKGYGV